MPDQQVDQCGRRTAHRRQRLLSDKLSHDHRVRRIVELLEKGSEQDREKEKEVLGMLFSGAALRAMNTPDEILSMSAVYMRVYFLGVIPSLVYNMGSPYAPSASHHPVSSHRSTVPGSPSRRRRAP